MTRAPASAAALASAKGDAWLKTHLVQAAWAAVHENDSYLRAKYHLLEPRRGPKKAIVAIASSMLTAAYHILRDDQPYRDLGPLHIEARSRPHMARRLVRRLEQLGYQVNIETAA